ncbi:409c5484-92f9-4df4-8345-923f43554212 [Thermothielavioides terrestris]|uniref:409c5484-92f9-4df4-8345-923f43554212 n=1 Tax=Thermothielavioides terrestris TaxID=2587410 RepID=A0A3S4BJ61_9PEZI|nr:409c5484-92f9-4df4-8345-923f43554212 [Thermothielavioides terrestris]
MVDNLAFTLEVGREDLNIGVLLPSVASIRQINFRAARWLLVIEKEATFRTLAASQYCKTSKAGHGILLTAKGFPDLTTRRFLCALHSIRPDLGMSVLVDFDPDGVAIMRTYKYGSKRLGHEENVATPQLRWLGIFSDDILLDVTSGDNEN